MPRTTRAPAAALLSAVAIVSACLLSACGSPASAGSSPHASILIGELTAGSGTYGSLSTEESQGRAFAVDQVNAAGGVKGHPLRLVSEDWHSDPSQVSNLATQLIR